MCRINCKISQSVVRLLLGVGCLSLSTLCLGNELKLAETVAGKAYKAGDFRVAEVEFMTLSEQYPGDLRLLRYHGIALDRLGEYQRAVSVFNRILAVDANNVATRYHLGVTYYKQRQGHAALDQFERVGNLAPDSRYAELAREYIQAIAEQRASVQRQGAIDRFGLFLQIGARVDDNVPASATITKRTAEEIEGTSGNAYLSADFYFVRNPKWVGTLNLSTYQARYDEDNLRRYDVSQAAGGISIQRNFKLGTKSIITKLGYEYFDIDLGANDEPYSESHKVSLSSLFHFSENQSATVYAQLREDDFEEEGFNPVFSSRDADRAELGLVYTAYFADKKADVTVNLSGAESDATGLNFNREALKAGMSLRFPSGFGTQIKLGANYTEHDYPEFSGPVRRETEITDYYVELSRWFGKHLLTRLRWQEHDEQSNYDTLSYRRKLWSMDVSYVY